jgi:hypothetical protein
MDSVPLELLIAGRKLRHTQTRRREPSLRISWNGDESPGRISRQSWQKETRADGQAGGGRRAGLNSRRLWAGTGISGKQGQVDSPVLVDCTAGVSDQGRRAIHTLSLWFSYACARGLVEKEADNAVALLKRQHQLSPL